MSLGWLTLKKCMFYAFARTFSVSLVEGGWRSIRQLWRRWQLEKWNALSRSLLSFQSVLMLPDLPWRWGKGRERSRPPNIEAFDGYLWNWIGLRQSSLMFSNERLYKLSTYLTEKLQFSFPPPFFSFPVDELQNVIVSVIYSYSIIGC